MLQYGQENLVEKRSTDPAKKSKVGHKILNNCMYAIQDHAAFLLYSVVR